MEGRKLEERKEERKRMRRQKNPELAWKPHKIAIEICTGMDPGSLTQI